MRLRAITLLVLGMLTAGFSVIALAQEKLNFALMVSRSEGDLFYEPLVRFSEAVAEDLGVTLKVYYAHDDRILYTSNIEKAAGEEGADAIILQSFKGGGARYVSIGERYKTPMFFFNDVNMMDEVAGSVFWVGEVTPDGGLAGGSLAQTLVERARSLGMRNDQGMIEVVALEGFSSSGASLRRVGGLQDYVAANPDVILHQVLAANWRREEAMQKMDGLYKRYPGVKLVWAASDSMALGVVDWAGEHGLTMGEDLLAGGIDWAGEALMAVADHQIEASYGGHFMEAGWSIVVMFDYLRGAAPASEHVSLSTHMDELNAGNVRRYLKLFGDMDWKKVDFRRFSRFHHPELTQYRFSLDELLRASEGP
ncbi:hypothetical protein EUZ85_12160 [Hahella sp. KA22]|uniref:ABC transporter substrate-binding protein n=1 Tax=Hahella sp. KA22 TaxID=1628392 RepID=UPI000FDE7387|nr:ABC transporter substrate-binding protein [Hahella sp. KA22]AZZ91448.1 hypothetical protein ENC22_09600 [Hahella sp. KA22]QAY54817.1 hypothetical protein EUZ85_12160 [Hahella sp. KA22]